MYIREGNGSPKLKRVMGHQPQEYSKCVYEYMCICVGIRFRIPTHSELVPHHLGRLVIKQGRSSNDFPHTGLVHYSSHAEQR